MYKVESKVKLKNKSQVFSKSQMIDNAGLYKFYNHGDKESRFYSDGNGMVVLLQAGSLQHMNIVAESVFKTDLFELVTDEEIVVTFKTGDKHE